MGILCVGVLILCMVLHGRAEEKETGGALLSLRASDEEWILSMTSVPSGCEFALLFDLSVGEDDVVPKMELCADPFGRYLTLGKPSDGRVRILIDGSIPIDAREVRLLRIWMTSPSIGPDFVAGAVLWIRDGDGSVRQYPISVDADDTEASTDPPSDESGDASFDDGNKTETNNSGSSDMLPSPSDGEEGTEHIPVSPESRPETEGAREPIGGTYLGCRETSDKEGYFSVKLYIWVPADASIPATVCFGGGQSVTLTVERLGGASVLVYTYRYLSADRETVFFIDTSDEIIQVLYRNGIFTAHQTAETPASLRKSRGFFHGE